MGAPWEHGAVGFVGKEGERESERESEGESERESDTRLRGLTQSTHSGRGRGPKGGLRSRQRAREGHSGPGCAASIGQHPCPVPGAARAASPAGRPPRVPHALMPPPRFGTAERGSVRVVRC